MSRRLEINELSMESIFTIRESHLKNTNRIAEEAADRVYAVAGAYYRNKKAGALHHFREDMDACERLLIMDHQRDAQALMALSHMIPRLASADPSARSTLIDAAETGEIDYAVVYYAAALNKALNDLDKKRIDLIYMDVDGHYDKDEMAKAKKNLFHIKRFYETVSERIRRKLSAKAIGLFFENLRINRYSTEEICRMHAAGALPEDWDDICDEASLYLLDKISRHLIAGKALEHRHFDVCEKLFFASDIAPALFYFRTITAALNHRTNNGFFGSMRYKVTADAIPEAAVNCAHVLNSMLQSHSSAAKWDGCWGQANRAEEARGYYAVLWNHLSGNCTVKPLDALQIFEYPLKEMCEMEAEDSWPYYWEGIRTEAFDSIGKKVTLVETGVLSPEAFTHRDVDVCERLFLADFERLRMARILYEIFQCLKDRSCDGFYGTAGQDVSLGEYSSDLQDYIFRMRMRSLNMVSNLEINSKGHYSPDQVADALPIFRELAAYYEKLEALVKQNQTNGIAEKASLSPANFRRQSPFPGLTGKVVALLRHRSSRADISDEELVEATEKLAIASVPTDEEIRRASGSYSGFLQENTFAGELRRIISELKDILLWAPSRHATAEKRTYTLLAVLSLVLALVCALPPVRTFMEVHTVIYAVIIAVVFVASLIFCISNVGGFLGFLIGVVGGVIGGVAIAGIISIFRYAGLVLALFFLFKTLRAPAVCRKNHAKYMKAKDFAKKLSEAQKHVRYLKDRFDRHTDCPGIDTLRAYYAAALAALEAMEKSL